MKSASIRAITSSYSLSRKNLNPFRVRKWLRFAFITALSGVRSGYGFTTALSISPVLLIPWISERQSFLEYISVIIAQNIEVALIGLLAFISIIYISSVFEFVLLEIPITGRAEIIKPARKYLYIAAPVFFLRFLIVLFLVLIVISSAAITESEYIPDMYVWIPACSAVILSLINGLTTDFAVPVMRKDKVGLVAAWRTILSIFNSDKKEYLKYIITRSILTILVLFIAILTTAVTAVLITLPASIFGYLYILPLAGEAEPELPGLIIFIFLLLISTITLIVFIVTLIQLPVKLYFRYYPLVVLGETHAEYKMIESEKQI